MIGDPTQLHQVLLNLCVNARDAMPAGGKLTVALENVILDDTTAAVNLHARSGPYIVLTVADTGSGIAPGNSRQDIRAVLHHQGNRQGHRSRPFHHQAIVSSHGGFIKLSSEIGKGTQFKVYFPAKTTQEATGRATVEQAASPAAVAS